MPIKDQVSIRAESSYTVPGGRIGPTNNLAVADPLQSLIGSAGFPAGKGLTATDIDQDNRRLEFRYLLPLRINDSLARSEEVFIYNLENSRDHDAKKSEERDVLEYLHAALNHITS
jgi:hypothetical protein